MTVSFQAAWRWVTSRLREASERVVSTAWPLLQQTAAATLAWLIAKYGLGRADPFFAPISAFIALNQQVGERGSNALRLLQGVIVGILVGELTIALLGGGAPAMALAIFVAACAARALGGSAVTVAQAAVGAILTVSVGDDEVGFDRVINALVGAGVALVFSQLLFSPEPVKLLRQAERAALSTMADALVLVARSLETRDAALATRAVDNLRGLPAAVAEVGRMRRASGAVARRSLLWRYRRQLVVRERENAGHIDLLGASCLFLARAAEALPESDGEQLEPSVRELAVVLGDVANDLGDRETRQRAAERALEVASSVTAEDSTVEMRSAVAAVRGVATDLVVFAGVDFSDAVEAVRAGILEQRVPKPPPEAAGVPRWLRQHRPPSPRALVGWLRDRPKGD